MYLLDTDTVIYALKGHPQVVSNLQLNSELPMAISAITLMELYHGAFKSRKTASNLAKVKTLEQEMLVLPIGPPEAEVHGFQKAALEQAGTPLDDFDLAIASCALANNLVLVTTNVRHFNRIEGLKLTNWSSDSEKPSRG
jgi:tRNA(fMet)-specific endonuclease VapC